MKTDEIQADLARKVMSTVFCYRRGALRTSGAGCLVPVLSCYKITFDHTRLNDQHISCRSSTGRCLILHLIARIWRPVINIFSYTSRNSCPVSVSVFRITYSPPLWARR